MIEIKIHQLLNAGYDLSEVYKVEVPEYMDAEFKVLAEQKVEIEIHKIQGGLSLNMPSQEVKGQVTCSRTLEDFVYKHKTHNFEMQAYKQIPEGIDPQDVLQINAKNMTLDIAPFIREAIFISLPYRFINAESRASSAESRASNPENKAPSESKSFQPFANLKDLL